DYNFRNREYRPSIGRWQTNDPIRYNAGDSNLYRYVKNGPTNGKDPSGLDVYVFGGGFFGIKGKVGALPTGGRHYTAMWYDPATGRFAFYDGGGPSGTGARAGSSAASGAFIAGSCFSFWANARATRDPAPIGGFKAFPATINGK